MAIIEIQNLTKYYGKSKGIEEVNLQVEEGEIFGFIGPNGAGKSTTIRLLMNFIFPTAGQAKVLGLDIVKDTRKIKEQVGYLPGEVDYYDDMTVRDLLDYAGSFYPQDCRSRTNYLAELFELDKNKKIHSLSLGNKKKVAIVQALLHKPRLLILDEPTGGLDPLMQKRFFDLLQQEHREGTTIFFSSHILAEVQKLCHRVAIIKDGSILKVEEMDKLRNDAFCKVRIHFAPGEDSSLALPGIIHSQESEGAVHMFYNGDVNLLLAHLAKRRLTKLWLQEPTLEEVFMHYYEKVENS